MRTGRKCVREGGFSLVELLTVVATIGVIASIVVPQLMEAYERSRQRRTLADLRSIAVANGTYRVDNRIYAGSFADLVPTFMDPVPPVDAWGTPWVYSGGGTSYTMTSLGRDSASGPAPPTPWYDEPFEADLVVTNGVFVQAPGSH